jgi:hypothetical protein
MDSWFDDLSRIMASPLPRRRAMRVILGGVAGTWLAQSPARALFAGAEKLDAEAGVGVVTAPFLRPGPDRCTVGATICRIGEVDQRLYCCPSNTTCCYPGTHRALCCESNEVCCEPIGAATDRRCCNTTFNTCAPDNAGVNRCRPRPTAAIQAVSASGVGISIQGDEEGLASVRVLSAINATVDLPKVDPGTRRVEVQAIKIDPSRAAQVRLEACISSGVGEYCTPSDLRLSELRIAEGRIRVRETFPGVAAADGFVTIQNSAHGVDEVLVLVNGKRAATLRMTDGAVLGVDVMDKMVAEKNTIAVVASGKPGASALVTLTRVLQSRHGGKTISDLPTIDWKPERKAAGAELRWGD